MEVIKITKTVILSDPTFADPFKNSTTLNGLLNSLDEPHLISEYLIESRLSRRFLIDNLMSWLIESNSGTSIED